MGEVFGTHKEGTAPLAPFPRSFIHIPSFIGRLPEYMKVDALAVRFPGFPTRPRLNDEQAAAYRC